MAKNIVPLSSREVLLSAKMDLSKINKNYFIGENKSKNKKKNESKGESLQQSRRSLPANNIRNMSNKQLVESSMIMFQKMENDLRQKYFKLN